MCVLRPYSLLLPLALSLIGALYADDQELFKMTDPRGDDSGTGALSYPSGSDFERGDLDLISFSAERGKEGTWFSVRFANAIRSPEGRTSKLANVPLANFARHDFYNLNVDIYIDTDNQMGSGYHHTLPGRKIRVSENTAWEKAVILCPRPSLATDWMEHEFARSLGESPGSEEQAKAEIKDHYYFSDNIQIRGKSIRFFVPDSFLGGPASPDWHYLVLVTGADPEQRMELSFFKQKNSGLLMMPVGNGRPFETFQLDYDADPNQPPIVDVLLPTVELQHDLLGKFNRADGYRAVLAGISPKESTPPEAIAGDFQAASEEPRPPAHGDKPPRPAKPKVNEPAVAVKPVVVDVPKAFDVHDQDQYDERRDPEDEDEAEEPRESDDDMEYLLAPRPPLLSPPPQADQPPPRPPEPSIADRLRQLEQLLKDKLISETEYQALRQKILDDL